MIVMWPTPPREKKNDNGMNFTSEPSPGDGDDERVNIIRKAI